MTRLLLLLLISIGIIALIYTIIKRIIKRFLGPFYTNENKSHNENDKKKAKVIYERDNVVVMKGDAPDNSERIP